MCAVVIHAPKDLGIENYPDAAPGGQGPLISGPGGAVFTRF
jgi:hypothetical protein